MSAAKKPIIYIEDILESIQAIYRFTEGLSHEAFLAAEKEQSAVTWKLAIIGEAVTKLPDAFIQTHPEIPWARIRGMRNLIIHEYYHVNLEVIWKTITEDLPPFEKQLKSILRD